VFTQLPNGERSTTGLGIGLRLVQKIAEMHDGTVEARSEGVGRGSEFIVRLPIGIQRKNR
jgi:signal transduction histidine kinase